MWANGAILAPSRKENLAMLQLNITARSHPLGVLILEIRLYIPTCSSFCFLSTSTYIQFVLECTKKIYKLHHLAPLCCTNHLKTIVAPSLWWICGVHMYVQLSLFLATCWQHPNLFVTNNYVYITGKLHASLGHLASKRFLWSSQNAGKPGLLFFFPDYLKHAEKGEQRS